MGRGKKNLRTAAAAASPPLPTLPLDDTLQLIANALTNNIHTDAIHLANEACRHHTSSSTAYLSRATVFSAVAKLSTTPEDHLRHLQTAASSALHAAKLSPSSIYAPYILAAILFDCARFSTDTDVYQEVIHVCTDALTIANPIDPSTEARNIDRKLLQLSTAEARIKHITQLLTFLRKNAEYSAMEPLPEVFLLTQLPATKRKKKATLDVTLKRKRNTLSYLESLTIANREVLNLWSVSVEDLRKAAANKPWDSDCLLTQALNVAGQSIPLTARLDEAKKASTENSHVNVKAFKLWPCCYCHEMLSDGKSLSVHVVEAHGLPIQMSIGKPRLASVDWITRSRNGGWSPLNDPLVQPTEVATAERIQLLEMIHRVFEELVGRRIFTASHLAKIQSLVRDEISDLPSATEEWITKVLESNECIRYSATPQLVLVCDFLEMISASCLIDKEDISVGVEETWIPLSLNQFTGFVDIDVGKETSDIGALIDWLYEEPTNHMLVWYRMFHDNRQTLEKLQVEGSLLGRLSEEKLSYTNALESLVKNRGLSSLKLKKHQEELSSTAGSNSIDLVTITEILKEAQDSQPSGSADQRSYDAYEAFDKMKQQLLNELLKTDARFMYTLRRIQELMSKIRQASAYDYRIALVPLVKAYKQMVLEYLAKKDAIAKAEALRQELLMWEDQAQGKGELDVKSKKKKSKKAKDKKDMGSDEQLNPHESTEKKYSRLLPRTTLMAVEGLQPPTLHNITNVAVFF